MNPRIHYRFMDKNENMTERTYFNTLSSKGQKEIIKFWNNISIDISNKENLNVLAILYGTRNIWVEVEELKKLLTPMKKIETLYEYQLLAARTLPDLGNMELNLLHMEAGATGEFLGEIVDIFKRKLAYKKEVDKVHLGEEIADTMWYIAGSETLLEASLEDPQAIEHFENLKQQALIGIKKTIVEAEVELEIGILAYILANKLITDAKRKNFMALIGVCMAICELLEIDFWQILTNNIAKLQVRYPEKFTTEAALNRDLDTERKELEK